MAEALTSDADLEELFVDSTIVRAHQHATGAHKKRAITPSDGAEGELSTQIHAAVEAVGNPLRVRLPAGYYRRDGPHQGD
jgi:hypothetical protein